MLKPLALAAALAFAVFTTDAAAQDKPVAQAVASRTEDGVTVRYTLSAPVDRVAFADTDTPRALWSVVTPGLALADGVVFGELPFDAFEIHILPDAEELDRTYIGLSEAGGGRVLYGPGLKLEGLSTALSFDLAPGEAAVPAEEPIDGYAYVGPSSAITVATNADVVAGANVPADLSAPASAAFFDALTFYERQLGRPLPFRPAVVISVDSPGPATFRGDVTDTGVISVRFYGNLWRETADDVAPFLWHEAFHLWNGHAIQALDADEAPWLHEGGADYAALIGATSLGALSEDQARERLMRRVNACRALLRDRDLDPARLQSGGAPYDCGVLVQWLADLDLRRTGGNVLELWRDLLGGAATTGGYGVADFRRQLPTDSSALLLLDGPGASRWPGLRARLAERGVTLVNRPGDRDLRNAALLHILRQNCEGAYGFSRAEDGLKLDDAPCGVLSGAPVVTTLEDVDSNLDGRAAFDAVQARCAAALPVRIRTADGRTLEATCGQPLVEPEVWAIADAPSLAVRDETSRPL